MEELCSEIERNIDEFKVPPIGPLGKYIKLTRKTGKDENLASLLQNQLGVKLLGLTKQVLLKFYLTQI